MTSVRNGHTAKEQAGAGPFGATQQAGARWVAGLIGEGVTSSCEPMNSTPLGSTG
jgi:hypothetical protein